jgi:hypothetical protein
LDYLDRGERVGKISAGFSLFIPQFIISEPESIANLMFDLKSKYDCKMLQNIEVNYYQTYYFFFGVPKLRIEADCVR